MQCQSGTKTDFFFLNAPAFEVLLPNWWEVDSLQKPDQGAVAFVELGMAFLADKL